MDIGVISHVFSISFWNLGRKSKLTIETLFEDMFYFFDYPYLMEEISPTMHYTWKGLDPSHCRVILLYIYISNILYM